MTTYVDITTLGKGSMYDALIGARLDLSKVPARIVDKDGNEHQVTLTSITETEDGLKITGKLVDQEAGKDD